MNSRTAEENQLRIIDCGIAEYREILKLQERLVDERRKGQIADTVLIVEHLPVITLGVRKKDNRLLASNEKIADENIDVVETRRGGGVTAHNPGQIVFYPILNLKRLNLNVREYIAKLQAAGKNLLEQLDVKSEIRKGLPGLWVDEKKIASIGVKVSGGVTYHGMAINIRNGLAIFDLFVPCGIEGIKMTSAERETGSKYNMEDVKNILRGILFEQFSCGRAGYENRTQAPCLA